MSQESFTFALLLFLVIVIALLIWLINSHGIKSVFKYAVISFFGTIVAILSSWIPSGIEPHLINIFGNGGAQIKWGVPALLMMFSGLIISIVGFKKISGLKVDYEYRLDTRSKNRKYKVLICAVSDYTKIVKDDTANNYLLSYSNKANEKRNYDVVSEDITEESRSQGLKSLEAFLCGDRNASSTLFPIFRAIENNRGSLEKLVLIGSKETKPVAIYLGEIIELYIPELKVDVYEKDVNYFDPVEIVDTLKKVVEGIIKKSRNTNSAITYKNILLDLTSGTKQISTAFGTFASFNKMHYQYVPNSKDEDVQIYRCSFDITTDL